MSCNYENEVEENEVNGENGENGENEERTDSNRSFLSGTTGRNAKEKFGKNVERGLARNAKEKLSKEAIKKVAEHAAKAVAAGATAGLSEVASIILKIVEWAKKHPFEAIAIGVLLVIWASIPIILIILIIYCLITGAMALLGAIMGFIEDVGWQLLDNITFGIVDWDTSRNVDNFMNLLDDPEAEMGGKADDDNTDTAEYGESNADNKQKTADMMWDMYDMTENYFDELYVKSRVPTSLQNVEFNDDIVKSNSTSEWLELPVKVRNKDLASVYYNISEDVLTKFYYGELYEKEANVSATSLKSGINYYGIVTYKCEDVNDVSKTVSEKLAKNKLFDYDNKTLDGKIVSKLEKGKTYYYVDDNVEYTHKGENVNRSNIVSYYDIVSTSSDTNKYLFDGITAKHLKDAYGITAEKTHFAAGFKDCKACDESSKHYHNFNELTQSYRDKEIRAFLKTRLTTYVSAENWFWDQNGDEHVELKDVVAAIYFPTGWVDIIGKTLDNNGIETNDFRKLPETSYNGKLVFEYDEENDRWDFDPEMSGDVYYYYDAATLPEEMHGLLSNINNNVNNTEYNGHKSRIIYSAKLFSYLNSQYLRGYSDNSGYEMKFNYCYEDNGKFIAYDEAGNQVVFEDMSVSNIINDKEITQEISFFEKDGYLMIDVRFIGAPLNELIGEWETALLIGMGKLDSAVDRGMTVVERFSDGLLCNTGILVKKEKFASEPTKEDLTETVQGKIYLNSKMHINDVVDDGVTCYVVANDTSNTREINEKELVKPYGVPSAFTYFVPLEESTRNIPFLIALAQEMRDTRIYLTSLKKDDKEGTAMVYEKWVVNVNTEDSVDTSNTNEEKIPVIRQILNLAFGEKDNSSRTLKTYDINYSNGQKREVILANLWDRTIVNEFKPVIVNSGNLIEDGTYILSLDYILANQQVLYNDKPYELITKYNVSSADVDMYEEVSGRPFLSQYSYEKVINEESLKEEWKGALEANKMLRPVTFGVVQSQEDTIYLDSEGNQVTKDDDYASVVRNVGVKYTGNGDVQAVSDGEIIAIEETEVDLTLELNPEEVLYSKYIIVYHEEDKTYSMYSMLEEFDKDIIEKFKKDGSVNVTRGQKLGEYSGDMYFEYRQGGREYINFWSASPISVNGKLISTIEELEGIDVPDESLEAAANKSFDIMGNREGIELD